ncbi:MAG: PaaD-like protein (DUF59) involved in Fe-S cluster assembly, partial [uncultured Thermomicrobiales bacterium]
VRHIYPGGCPGRPEERLRPRDRRQHRRPRSGLRRRRLRAGRRPGHDDPHVARLPAGPGDRAGGQQRPQGPPRHRLDRRQARLEPGMVSRHDERRGKGRARHVV